MNTQLDTVLSTADVRILQMAKLNNTKLLRLTSVGQFVCVDGSSKRKLHYL